MCDKECRDRFRAIEINIAQIGTDIKWVKKLVLIAAVGAGAVLGVDVTGLVGV